MAILRVTGLVADERTIEWDESSGAPPSEVVSVAEVVGDVAEAARFCSVISSDQSYRASIPIADLLAGGVLEVNPAAEPGASGGGGPVRLRVIEGTTLCWNVKDVGELRFTAAKEPDDVPSRPTH